MPPDPLAELCNALLKLAPHNVLNTLVNGGATTFYDQSSFMEQTGWHPGLSFNEIESGITFSELKIPATYTGQMDARDKGEFTIYNNSGHVKKFLIDLYQDWCTVQSMSGGTPRCSYGQEHPQIAPPRMITIGPGGAEKVEFWYSTPNSPPHNPEYEDTLRIKVIVQITDEQGKRAKLSGTSTAVIPAP